MISETINTGVLHVPRLGMGPETPRVPKEGKLRADSRSLGPPWGSETSCVHPDLPCCVGVRSRHVSRRHEFEREPSAGRLARLPHSMLVVEACSATTARGAALVRPTVYRVLPRYTVQPHPRIARLPH